MRAPHSTSLGLVTSSLAILFSTFVAASGAAHAEVTAVESEPSILEPPLPRQGYFFDLGVYGLAFAPVEDGDSYGIWPGQAFAFRAGQMVTRQFGLALAIELGGASGEGGGRDQTGFMAGLAIEAQYVFLDRLALFGGVGVGFVQLDYDQLQPDEEETTRGVGGSYFAAGISYAFFPYKNDTSGGLSIGPSLRVRHVPGEDTRATAILLGVDFTWWTGLPKNQLDLPLDEAFD